MRYIFIFPLYSCPAQFQPKLVPFDNLLLRKALYAGRASSSGHQLRFVAVYPAGTRINFCLQVEDVTSGDAIQRIFEVAKKNRMVAATNCNERSSRSHSVFILKIAGHNTITSEACTGTLNLVRSHWPLGYICRPCQHALISLN